VAGALVVVVDGCVVDGEGRVVLVVGRVVDGVGFVVDGVEPVAVVVGDGRVVEVGAAGAAAAALVAAGLAGAGPPTALRAVPGPAAATPTRARAASSW
jgi:hypothetical protein